jgi:Tol biopolymer transport system component
MKIPVIPLVVATSLVAVVVFLFNSMSSGKKTFGPPQLQNLVDLEGVESELAVSPDGTRLVAVASGDLWLFTIRDGGRRRLTETFDAETAPAWAPDGQRVTFTRSGSVYSVRPDNQNSIELFKENASTLSWSTTGRMAFVRDRTVWVTDAGGINEHALIERDANPDIIIRTPRFSPNSTQVAFVKSDLGLQGEVWIADTTTGAAEAVIADRWAENPLDVGWLANGRQLVYLTNRGGGYGLWIIDFDANTILPLTSSLTGMPMNSIGMAVWQDRIFLPRHDVDSDIVLSDGTVVAQSADPEFEPAVSRDGALVAYTVQKDNRFEIWTAGIHGENPTFHAIGTQPRFSPNGFEVVYTHTDVLGRVDLRKLDIRDGSSSTITDAAEIDFEPDWSPDGRTIAFASNKGGTMGLWATPAVNGKRVSLNLSGYFPRYSPDGRSLLFWSQQAIWQMEASGGNPRRVRDGFDEPTPAVWVNNSPKTYRDPEIHGGRQIWPAFDVLPDGRLLTAPIEIREAALWTADLTYVEE